MTMGILQTALFVFLSVIFFNHGMVYAQSDGVQTDGSRRSNVLTSVPFLLITPQARSGAMGNAGVAVEADANSPSLNMASMAYLKDGSYGFSVTYTPWLKNLTQGMSLSYLSGYYRIDERNTIAAALRYFSIGDVKFIDNNQQDLGVFNPNEFAADLSYARSFGNSPYVKMKDKKITIGSIGTLEEKRIGPFKAYLEPGIPFNSVVEFKVNYDNSDDYDFSEFFSYAFNQDYINYKFNQISTTATSNGRIGYRNANADLGSGFIYNNENLLYEGSLIMGISPQEISNNSRIDNTTADEDFVPVKRVQETLKTDSLFQTVSEFNDSGNTNPLNVSIKQVHTAYRYSPDDKYLIVTYMVRNNNSFPLNKFYIGLLSDWDMDQNSNDITTYIPAERLGMTYAKNDPATFAGIKLLNTNYPANYYPLASGTFGNPLEDGVLSRAEKFEIISSGIKAKGLGDQTTRKTDVSLVSSYGPITLKPKASTSFSFALLVEQSQQALEQLATIAQRKHLEEALETSEEEVPKLHLIYPNPVLTKGNIKFSIPNAGLVTMTIYNSIGQKIKTLTEQHFESGLHSIEFDSNQLPSGVYVYQMQYNRFKQSHKIVVVK